MQLGNVTITLTDEQVRAVVAQALTDIAGDGRGPAKAKRASQSTTGPSDTAIRAWAVDRGIEVNTKGRVKKEIKQQYLAEHS